MGVLTATATLDVMAREIKGRSFKDNAWGNRHWAAWFAPNSDFELTFSLALKGLAAYADAHNSAYHTPLGNDCVLSIYWLDSLKGLAKLRDGETGRFDCGALGEMMIAMAKAAGFEDSDLDEGF